MGMPHIFGLENNTSPISCQISEWTLEYPYKDKELKIKGANQLLNIEKADRFNSYVS